MADLRRWRISLKQAIYLALMVLAIYYPITIYVNVPADHIFQASAFLLIPAAINFVFYGLLILATDRLIDWVERLWGEKFLTEFRFTTLLLSIPFAILATFFSHLLFTSSFTAVDMLLGPPPGAHNSRMMADMTPQQWENLKRTTNGLTLMIVLSIFYLIINRKASIRMKDMEVQAEQLTKENALAQYEALKNQVSPHFLFNSLSILSSLVHVDPNLSEKFIDQLSKAYRYILEQKDNDTVSLKTELDFLRSYAFLLKIRFERKLEVNIAISDAAADEYRIAPLTLQLLIENCVKHNRMSNKEPLEVTILIEGNQLMVLNPIRIRNEQEKIMSTGIGLTNITNRYKLLTDTSVEITQTHETFIVKIPLL